MLAYGSPLLSKREESGEGSLKIDSETWYEALVRNLFARQSRIHLIKLPKTIALHAYATNIQN
jgi:hypothetical protein